MPVSDAPQGAEQRRNLRQRRPAVLQGPQAAGRPHGGVLARERPQGERTVGDQGDAQLTGRWRAAPSARGPGSAGCTPPRCRPAGSRGRPAPHAPGGSGPALQLETPTARARPAFTSSASASAQVSTETGGNGKCRRYTSTRGTCRRERLRPRAPFIDSFRRRQGNGKNFERIVGQCGPGSSRMQRPMVRLRGARRVDLRRVEESHPGLQERVERRTLARVRLAARIPTSWCPRPTAPTRRPVAPSDTVSAAAAWHPALSHLHVFAIFYSARQAPVQWHKKILTDSPPR